MFKSREKNLSTTFKVVSVTNTCVNYQEPNLQKQRFPSVDITFLYRVTYNQNLVDSTFLCSKNYLSDHIDGLNDKPEHKEASNRSF